ncbi:MAG: DUF4349 domain-containing protein [Chitinophagaceae bacterium]
MNKFVHPRIIYFLFLIFTACGTSENKDEPAATTDSVASKMVSSTAAIENNKDSLHSFIRTAELKFKVKSVIKSTYDIEDIVARQDGFVTYTNLASNINNISTTPVSRDSSLETTYYVVSNTITLRIPNTKLDTTLKEISRNIDYLDYRIIKADDVRLQILSNDLTQKRSSKNQERVTKAIDNKGGKLNETTNAEEAVLSKQEQADNAKISNLSLKDQINFSTVNIIIYQRETLTREMVSNNKNIEAYEPGFGSKIVEALKSGWSILAGFIVFLAKLWGVILFIIIALFLYKRYGNKMRK